MYRTGESQGIRYTCLYLAHIQNSQSLHLKEAMGIYNFIETLESNCVVAKELKDADYIEDAQERIYVQNHLFWELMYKFWKETGIRECLMNAAGQLAYSRHKLFG